MTNQRNTLITPPSPTAPATAAPSATAGETSGVDRAASPHRARARRALTVVVAAAAALFVWLIAEALMSEPILVPESPGSSVRTELAAGAVIGAAVFAGIAGWLSLAVLERFVDRAARAWTGLALVVLVVSMPWVGEFSAAERVALAGMHLAVGAVLVSGLVATAKRR